MAKLRVLQQKPCKPLHLHSQMDKIGHKNLDMPGKHQNVGLYNDYTTLQRAENAAISSISE